jgi:hypothetical protein
MIKFNIDKQIKRESKVTDRQLILKTSNMEVSSEIGLKFSDLIYSDFIEDLKFALYLNLNMLYDHDKHLFL